MKLSNPVVAKKMYLTLVGNLPTIEHALAVTVDPVARNRAVRRLARLDQEMAGVRDALIEAGYAHFD